MAFTHMSSHMHKYTYYDRNDTFKQNVLKIKCKIKNLQIQFLKFLSLNIRENPFEPESVSKKYLFTLNKEKNN